MSAHVRLVPLALVLAACGGGGSPDGGPGDGEPCTTPSQAVVAQVSAELLGSLSVDAEHIVYFRRTTLFMPTVIERVGRDGTGVRALHTSTLPRGVDALLVHEGQVLFLEHTGGTVPRLELFRVPLAGGAATRVGTADFAPTAPRFFGADGQNVYFVSGGRIRRVALSDGSSAEVAQVTGTILHTRLSQDELFYGEATATFRVARTATGATPTRLPDALGRSTPCAMPLAGLFPTPTRLVCGFNAVGSWARDGSDERVLVPAEPLGPGNVPVGTRGETVFLLEPSDGVAPRRLKQVSTAGGPVTTVACDVRAVANRAFDRSGFPDASGYELAVGPSDVVWIERRGDAPTTLSYSLRRAAR